VLAGDARLGGPRQQKATVLATEDRGAWGYEKAHPDLIGN
jgi:hypothetical protein